MSRNNLDRTFIKNPSHLTLILTFFQMNSGPEDNSTLMNVDVSPSEIRRQANIARIEAELDKYEEEGFVATETN